MMYYLLTAQVDFTFIPFLCLQYTYTAKAYLSLWKGAAASDTSPSDEKIQSLKLQNEHHKYTQFQRYHLAIEV